MIRFFIVILVFLLSQISFSQVGIGTENPNNDAVLDVVSNNGGVLITRVALTSISSPVPMLNHVAGMIVYNTANSGVGNDLVSPGFYYNEGSYWVRLEPQTTEIGDVKQSILTQDHNGWYLLDGRNISSLSAKAQSNASLLGFVSNLPNANDSFFKGKSNIESMAASGGNNLRTLSQENFPNVMFSGTTDATGGHSHNYEDKYHGSTENLNIVTGLLGILSGTVLNIMNNDVGAPVVANDIGTSTLNGLHNHTVTVNTGGSSLPLPLPSYLVTNAFVYLGK